MIAVRPGRDGTPAHWCLTGRTPGGADVVATAPLRRPARGPGWQRAVERLRDGEGDLRVERDPDGRYRWVLADANDDVVAQSSATYRDADGCRRAFAFARRAARAVVGGIVVDAVERHAGRTTVLTSPGRRRS